MRLNCKSVFYVSGMGAFLSLVGSVSAQDKVEKLSVVDPGAIVDLTPVDRRYRVVDPGAIVSSSPLDRHYGVVDPSAIAMLGQASRALEAERSAAAPEVLDSAFDVYAKPTLLAMAYESSDSTLLTDVALQLAEGERVLLRSRKALSAEQVMDLALRSATQQQDSESLNRIAKFAEATVNKELAAKVAAARKLAAVSRDTASNTMMVPVEDVDVNEFVRLRQYYQHIERARLLGDARGLQALNLDLEGCIPRPYQKQMKKRIDDAIQDVPADQKTDDKLLGALMRLQQISRWEADTPQAPPTQPSESENTPADEPVQVSSSY